MNTDMKDPFFKEPREVFHVPEGYFEKLPLRVMERIHQEETSKKIQRERFVIRRWPIWIGAAAAVLIIGWLGFSKLIVQSQDLKYQQEIAWLVEIAANDLNESNVVSYLSDSGFDWDETQANEEQDALLSDPEFMRTLTLESIIY